MVKLSKGLKFKVAGMTGLYEIEEIKSNFVIISYENVPDLITMSFADVDKGFKAGKYIPIFNKNVDGMFCVGCYQFSPMATVNQPNKTFKCFKCRSGY